MGFGVLRCSLYLPSWCPQGCGFQARVLHEHTGIAGSLARPVASSRRPPCTRRTRVQSTCKQERLVFTNKKFGLHFFAEIPRFFCFLTNISTDYPRFPVDSVYNRFLIQNLKSCIGHVKSNENSEPFSFFKIF